MTRMLPRASLDWVKQEIDEQRPDVVVLDLNMPAMDGWDFIKKYDDLTVSQKERTVIIMLTTSFNPEDELKARAIPSITGFRNKPLTAEMLEGILLQYF